MIGEQAQRAAAQAPDAPALAFAVIEGVALGVRSVLQVLEHAGSPLTELRVGGGGARLGLAAAAAGLSRRGRRRDRRHGAAGRRLS